MGQLPYWCDERGRYGTGESYNWFPKYDGFEGETEVEILYSVDGLWAYAVEEDGVVILRYDGNETEIVVPSCINGRQVVELNFTFDGFWELKSVVVPEGVKSIEGAFYGCTGLEKVILPQSLADMSYAFQCCYSLAEIEIPHNVKYFQWAFSQTGLKQVDFPLGAEDISFVLTGTDTLEAVFIPETVTDMTEAFCDCENLRQVVLEDGIRRIGDNAFFHCTSLGELAIPESVTEFGENSVGIEEIREYMEPQKLAYRMRGLRVLDGFVIKGKAGSEAERYARENGIEFVQG